MESISPVAAAASPVSDGKIWNALRCRVDTILEERKPKLSSTRTEMPGSDTGKRLREDSLLLMRGFDSVSSSLSQLTGILDSAAQNVRELAKPPLTEVLKDGIRAANVYKQQQQEEVEEEEQQEQEEEEPKPKRPCSLYKLKSSSPENKEAELDHGTLLPGAIPEDDNQHKTDDGGDKKNVTVNCSSRNDAMENARKLAVSMATKASILARELKTIRSELGFMQDRCALLEEENRRLREGFHDGLRSDEEDLVRLQLETLLAEKSKLASENSNLIRENQCLQQLVEYHQMTSLELSESYDHIAQYGTCLDFSPFIDDEDAGKGDVDEERNKGF